MKRSYNSSNGPPPHAQTSPYGGGYATHSAPPLPPGPPPPPPGPASAPDPYAAYGYGSGANQGQQQGQQQQVMASHPQYPGYGYGTAAGAPTSTSTPYSSVSVPADANAAATAAQYAAYYAAYAQQASAAAAAANAAASSPYQATQSPYGAAGGPPFGAPGPPGPSGSPGAPPFKRTRYDQPHPPLPPGPPPGPGAGYGNAPMPPSVLPPIGGASGRGPPPPRGPPMGRGPPPLRGGDQYGPRPGGDMPFGRDGPGMRGGPRGGPGPAPGRGPPGMGPGQFDDGMRGGPGGFGGQGPITLLRGGPVGPRGGMREDRRGGPPLGPAFGSRPGPGMGPTGARAGLPPAPGPSNFNGPAGPRGLGAPNAPKGPKGAASRPSSGANVGANQQAARRERKWGSTSGGTGSSSSKKDRHANEERERDSESAKRTLTDFRIEGLAIPELEWEWRAERVEQEMRRAAEELDRQVKEKAENGRKEQEASEGGEHIEQKEEAGDMSVDAVNVEDLPARPSDPTATATVAAGKHRRDEDDDSAQVDGAAPDTSGTNNGAAEHEHASKPKKVRTGDLKLEDGEPVSLDSLHPPEGTPVKEANGDDEDGQPIKEETHEPEGEEEDVDGAPIDSAQTDGDEQDRSSVRDDSRSSPPPAPAPPRENSRLRIYFSSPTASTSSYAHPSGLGPPRASSVSASVKSASVPPQSHQQESTSGHGGQVEPVPTPDIPADLAGEQFATPVDGAEVMEKIEEGAEKEQAEQMTDAQANNGANAAGEPFAGKQQVVEGGEAAQEADVTAASGSATEDDVEALSVTQAKGLENSEPEQPQEVAAGEAASSKPEEAQAASASDPFRAPSAASSAAPTAPESIIVPPEPAADRISISYARNTRRMLLDAEVIDEVKIKRGDGKIELKLRCKPAVLGEGERQVEDEFRVLKGVLVEALDVEADDYVVMDRTALTRSWEPSHDSTEEQELDPLLPPLHRLQSDFDSLTDSATALPATFAHETITIVAQLDRLNPLTEARWVKTGDVDNWIVSLGISSGANPKETDKLSEWRNKVKVVDPDPPPTIQNALESWAASSSVGSRKERNDFVKTHMSNIDNVVEILLRLTRGDRAGPSHYSSSAQPPTVGALAATLSAPFPDQQTQVSLAVLAMFRLSMSTAEKAGIPKEEIERQVGEIIRGIPAHLQFKAVDGIFREVVKGHKGGSGGGGRGKKGGRRD
ncbi:proteasome subunit alpha type 1 [Rhodotorula toruloides]|uniref:Proteasome subunit alpha type 1 n=1 Tax=Rhodotorula toruloides TaxID=5286 RepID=A0A511KHS6_RHOTO|nr:proteasome subunit alpha type 1 [Rhodotorula toruloides]